MSNAILRIPYCSKVNLRCSVFGFRALAGLLYSFKIVFDAVYCYMVFYAI